MKPKVYITYSIPPGPLERLKEHCEVVINDSGKPLTREELAHKLPGADAVASMFFDRFDHAMIDSLAGVKIIANYAVGYNNIDVEYAAAKSIAVTNTPGVLTDATADLAWGLLFAAARRIPESDRFTREGRFTGWTPTAFLGLAITGKTLGIIGAGRIGSNFAKKAKGFEMRILYHNRKPDPEFENETGATYVDKRRLLEESDFVSLHVPLTPETRSMIGMDELRTMKRNAILINTSRGPVVDEKALVKALKEGYIWGAGLDVYENEPLVEPELICLENVILTPHIGSSTEETRIKMAEMVVENVLAALNGHVPPNQVN